ncbi:hypothetical protein Ahy_A09g041590 [Arachis hypogaea]|uniref:Uncharacterized protein n=1 Tax=Arachis hypogaea TaxID=3818 RepID=A0A445BD72_ARAHY|nr:hypothetical protein Ahy_A09g041590 [Arachis hypogaea]
MSGDSSAVKLEIEKFDGRINFGLWQVQVKDVLIQSGLHKALKEKISVSSSLMLNLEVYMARARRILGYDGTDPKWPRVGPWKKNETRKRNETKTRP